MQAVTNVSKVYSRIQLENVDRSVIQTELSGVSIFFVTFFLTCPLLALGSTF